MHLQRRMLGLEDGVKEVTWLNRWAGQDAATGLPPISAKLQYLAPPGAQMQQPDPTLVQHLFVH